MSIQQNLENKIDKVKELKADVEDMVAFIELAERVQTINKEHDGVSKFKYLTLEALCSTGSQSADYKRIICGNDLVKCLVNAGLPILKGKLEQKKKELSGLFK